MKRTLMALMLVFVAGEVTPQQSDLTIEGRVLRESTSEAVPGVLVLLSRSGDETSGNASPPSPSALGTQIEMLRIRDGNRASGGSEEAVRNVLRAAGSSASSAAAYAFTDNGGRFSFKDLPAGNYTIRIAREGYFGPKVNGSYLPVFLKTIELNQSNPVMWVDARMTKASIVTGYVRNSRSVPSRLAVTAYRMGYVYGKERWTAELVVSTNNAGYFELKWVAPGELYVGAGGTFFRDVTQAERATKVVALEGEKTDMGDINIQPVVDMPRKVSGSAINAFAAPGPLGVVDFSVANFLLVLRDPGLADQPYTRVSNALPGALAGGRRTNAEFEITRVKPGSYELISYFTEPMTRRTLIGRAPLQVVGSDVNGISVPILAGATLSGEFRVNGVGAEMVNPGAFSLTLESLGHVPTSFVTEPNPIMIDASGRFTAFNVPQERYRFRVGNLPPMAYVADIRQGNRSVFDEGFDLAEGTGEIQIVVQTQGQFLSGTARTADGIPAVSATVVLVPPEAKRQNPMHYRFVNTDANGAFKMENIPPGEYTVFAWENILPTAWMNPKVLDMHQKRGRSVSLTSGVPLDLQLPVIPDTN